MRPELRKALAPPINTAQLISFSIPRFLKPYVYIELNNVPFSGSTKIESPIVSKLVVFTPSFPSSMLGIRIERLIHNYD